ncbi:hypothetical protein AX16_005112 [Volvariella volvacea WC 439]|nr:hypothetical protein AX16_005112 [Volvariella volvacea WC 439]
MTTSPSRTGTRSSGRIQLCFHLMLSSCRHAHRSYAACYALKAHRRLRLGSTYHTASPLFVELGVRSDLPPDTEPQNDSKEPVEISDQDWEIRTGRAIYVLQQTLPEFFSTGLVTSIDKATGTPRTTNYQSYLPQHLLNPNNFIPGINANPHDYHNPETIHDSLSPAAKHSPEDATSERIYSDKVRLSYTPPVALPAPFPRTLHIEGFPLYLTSSLFVKHTMNALYSDLHVVLRRVIVNTPSPPSASSTPLPEDTSPPTPSPSKSKRKSRISREKSLFISLSVAGTSRVSGSPGEWEVNSTYAFSPLTGLILSHTINSIYPAPHQAVYDALRGSFGKVFGLGLSGAGASGDGSPRPGGAAGVTCGDGRGREREHRRDEEGNNGKNKGE